LEDLRDLVGKSRSKFVDWCAEHIPGYGGYKEKETRREADKMLRIHIAKQLYDYRLDVMKLQEKIVEQKRIDELNKVDKLSSHLEILEDRIKYAEYGYSGFFDNVKVDEGALDKLYEFDANLLQMILEVKELVKTLKENIDGEGDVFLKKVEETITCLEEIERNFNDRKDVLMEAS